MTECCLFHEIAMKTLTVYWVLPFLLILFLLVGCNQRQVLRIGQIPQRVELADMHGKTVAFPDDFKDRVVMLRFWSVSCPFCNKEIIKSMETLYLKYQDQGFVAVSVNVNQPPEVAEEFRKLDKLITFPALLDPEAKAANAYGVKSLPTTFILDRQGVVAEKVIGETGIDMFESFLPSLLLRKQP